MRLVFLTVAVAAATAVAAPLFVQAQGVPQTVQLTKVDVIKVATGFRASKVIGSSVVNDAGDTVGRVDDVIIAEEGKAPFVVLAVGGFLGIGDKLFAVPWNALTLDADRKCFVLDATKESFERAPGFDKDHWPSMADQQWAGEVHDFYGVRPYWSNISRDI